LDLSAVIYNQPYEEKFTWQVTEASGKQLGE
jgi:hypothetical protein